MRWGILSASSSLYISPQDTAVGSGGDRGKEEIERSQKFREGSLDDIPDPEFLNGSRGRKCAYMHPIVELEEKKHEVWDRSASYLPISGLNLSIVTILKPAEYLQALTEERETIEKRCAS